MRVFVIALLVVLFTPSSVLSQTNSGSAEQVRSHEQKAHQLLSEKKPELAVKEFAAVLAADPHNLDAQANLGVLLYFQRHYASAEPHLREAVNQQSDLTKIRALLGLCERKLGKTEAARSDLEASFRHLDDANVRLEVGLELIEIHTASGDLAKAAVVVESLRQSAPTDARILYAAYRIYTDLAGESLLDLSVAAPNSGQMYQAMAHELVKQRENNGAITDFRKALAVDPNLPGIHYELAEVLRISPDQKFRAEAEEEYKRAVGVNASDEKALERLGDMKTERGEMETAIGYYNKALALSPNDADALQGLARIYTERNNPALALALLERVVANDPTNVQAHYRLSVVYRKLNRPQDAKRELDDYQKYKDMKEKLRAIYKELRVTDDKDGHEREEK